MEANKTPLLEALFRGAGFSLDDVPRIHRHHDYSARLLELEPIFITLAQSELPYGAVSALAKASDIPKGTLRDWRSQLKRDPSWRPSQGYGQGRRLLSNEEEAELAKRIREQYVDRGRYCPPLLVNRLASQIRARRDAEEEDHPEESPDEDDATPKRRHKQFTHTWRDRFLREAGFSLRRPHLKRRPKPDDEYLARFLTEMEMIFTEYPINRIINADETSWKIINNRMVTLANRGAEAVTCQFEGDLRACMTVIASIDAGGSKLPLWVICRGKTHRCEACLRTRFASEIKAGKLVLAHQENGWTNRVVALEYLEWLSRKVKGQKLCLLWDCFSAHRDGDVRRNAEEREIALKFVPGGMTEEWQPLDLRIFGSLKQRARALFDAEWTRNPNTELSIENAIGLLIRAWGSITQEEILDAWSKLRAD
jgi:transposase-like protein